MMAWKELFQAEPTLLSKNAKRWREDLVPRYLVMMKCRK
jgi:hypothetical protein